MSYTPTNWATGDTITATKLNKIENGIASAGGGGLVTDTSDTLDKTYNELISMISAGVIPYLLFGNRIDTFIVCPLVYAEEDEVFLVRFYSQYSDETFIYTSSTADGSLVFSE